MEERKIRLNAQTDLKHIGRYTEGQWGKNQRNIYLKALEKRFEWLAEHPRPGKHRPDVMDDYYSFPQGEHVIFYQIKGGSIDIIGILHRQMDMLTYFWSDSTDG